MVSLVRFHGDVGGGAQLSVAALTRSDGIIGELGSGGGGACVGRGQGGFPDFVLSLVKQDVGSIGHNLGLCSVRHFAVIEVIPLAVVLVLGIAGVVSVPESSVVIGHSNEVIAAPRLPIGQIFPQEVTGEVQGPKGKLHDAVKLLSGELGVGESLQVDDQHLGQRPQVQLFCGQLVFLTHRTVPWVLILKCLHSGEQLDTLLQLYRGLLLRNLHTGMFVILLSFVLIIESLLHVRVPVDRHVRLSCEGGGEVRGF